MAKAAPPDIWGNPQGAPKPPPVPSGTRRQPGAYQPPYKAQPTGKLRADWAWCLSNRLRIRNCLRVALSEPQSSRLIPSAALSRK